ncbi:MAG TPA: PilZ domain-containing protein [Caulobacteraceae bacterium]
MSEPLSAPVSAPIEQRRAPRQRVILGGKIVLSEGLSFDCTIRDLSQTGARIGAPRHEALPDEFMLIENKSGTAYRVEVARRETLWVGVRFRERFDLRDPISGLKHLRQLWLESQPRTAGVLVETTTIRPA